MSDQLHDADEWDEFYSIIAMPVEYEPNYSLETQETGETESTECIEFLEQSEIIELM